MIEGLSPSLGAKSSGENLLFINTRNTCLQNLGKIRHSHQNKIDDGGACSTHCGVWQTVVIQVVKINLLRSGRGTYSFQLSTKTFLSRFTNSG
ncbi:hypothetical protein BH11BAC1_BH11BAC1_02990 [soil metagenome]